MTVCEEAAYKAPLGQTRGRGSGMLQTMVTRQARPRIAGCRGEPRGRSVEVWGYSACRRSSGCVRSARYSDVFVLDSCSSSASVAETGRLMYKLASHKRRWSSDSVEGGGDVSTSVVEI